MKYIVWSVMIVCTSGAPIMLMIYVRTGNSLALINGIWSVVLVFWCFWMLDKIGERQ